jgi:DNA-binding transcriptional LysR family regulator
MAASSGIGIAMLPSYVAAHNRHLRPVLPNYFSVRDIWLSVHEDILHVGRIKAVMNFLDKRIVADRNFLMLSRAHSKTSSE